MPHETLRVRDVMTAPAIAVRPDTTIGELVRRFLELDGHLLAVTDDHHVLAGTVSRRDVLQLLDPDGPTAALRVSELAALYVASIMRKDPVVISELTGVDEALGIMRRDHLPSLPVVTPMSGKPVLVGIISRSDIARGAGRRRAPRAAARR